MGWKENRTFNIYLNCYFKNQRWLTHTVGSERAWWLIIHNQCKLNILTEQRCTSFEKLPHYHVWAGTQNHFVSSRCLKIFISTFWLFFKSIFCPKLYTAIKNLHNQICFEKMTEKLQREHQRVYFEKYLQICCFFFFVVVCLVFFFIKLSTSDSTIS